MTVRLAGALRIEGLTKRYANLPVVTDFTATIGSGQFFSLLGPSGSGKTTTLMMIAGFTEPDGGSIRLDGKDMTRLGPQHRGLGMVFQNYALFPHLDVFENVAFPLRARRVAAAQIRARVVAALKMVGLERFAASRPRELSGGQQQRVALARAVVFDPQIVLMDEPLGALDKNLRYRMQVEIKEIQQRLGMTIVYVTHDQEEAMNMSDVIAIMNNGRIEQIGRPREIYERPANVFVSRFLGEANLIAGTSSLMNGEAQLRTVAGKQLAASGTAGMGSGQPACLFVRPEKIGLTAPGAIDLSPTDWRAPFRGEIGPGGASNRLEGPNRLEGIVRRVSFLGNVVRYGIEVGEPELLVVDVQNGASGIARDVGATVVAVWSPGDCRILANG
jgi:putative spermidine/putrescine transport system ATP-binding protein